MASRALADAIWPLFERLLFPVRGSDDLFNPYRDSYPDLDHPEAPALRRSNLRAYVAAYRERPPLFLLVEAPGPWGCRFSGVPITSEAQLVDPGFPLDGAVSNATGEPHTEYSASIFWRILQPAFPHFFVWNTVPFHPHRAGEPLTIRAPRQREIDAQAELTAGLLEVLRPRRVLAVGRKAERALARLGRDATYVRHPSQGGAKLFEAGVREALAAEGIG